MTSRLVSVFVLALAVVALAGCGGEEKDKEQAAKACPPAPAAMTKAPTLPVGFPAPQGIVYTGETTKGPTTIVTGYLPVDIDAAYEDYKGAFVPPYSVTKSEQENVDAEVNFAGPSTTGQVKLLQGCKDRTTVTITVRPA